MVYYKLMILSAWDSKWINFLKCKVQLYEISSAELYKLYSIYVNKHCDNEEWKKIEFCFDKIDDNFLNSYLYVVVYMIILDLQSVKKPEDIDRLYYYFLQVYDLDEKKFFDLLEEVIITIIGSKNIILKKHKKTLIEKIKEETAETVNMYSKRFLIGTIRTNYLITNYLKNDIVFEYIDLFFKYYNPILEFWNEETFETIEEKINNLEEEFKSYIDDLDELEYVFEILSYELYKERQKTL